MIKSLSKILFIIFIFISIFTINNTFATNNYNSQYISLNPESSKSDIIKFQKFFKALKIYNWNLDWKYSSIKPDIIKFQLKYKIIKSKSEDWAGYIWPKTYKFFTDRYWDRFNKAYSNFFEIKQVDIKNENCFIVSAYYSPLPNQKRYSTKSYNWDIRLNWNWTHWASGAWVHPWFIAAPSHYPFWTKIELEWLWIWVVEDRGWAIVKKWVRWYECDRLDIWMWYGDEWLKRALTWGKKKISWKIVDRNKKITISFPSDYREYLAIKIKPKSTKSDLEKMQKLFKEARLYSWKIDWQYSSFKDEIIDFQVKNHIIKNKNDYAAGYIWAKTIKKLEEIYPDNFIVIRRKDISKTNEKNSREEKIISENKTWNIIENKNIKEKSYNLKSLSQKTQEITKKYKITIKEKEEVDKLKAKIVTYLNKKIWNNKLKKKTATNKIRKNIIKSIKKIKNTKTKNKLTYLKDIL